MWRAPANRRTLDFGGCGEFVGGHQVGSLYHFAARYYDPGLARWTQRDPINQYDDLTQANLFGYAGW
jgi:RHS repeat-associated protein